ncbi:MAG: nucleotidyltransferase substrate binding protein [Mediterranea sp.]|jgi:nucleotidyltransferase substrate binding protein (TIGR01987 family)|nr:nucleotidyltransferase substrate binding protein [Mediterranea sp.]
MEQRPDIRWKQRFSNYREALAKLDMAIAVAAGRDMGMADEVDELLREGLIQRFEYTHELAWNMMKDYLEYQGYTDIRGPRDAIRKALEEDLINDARWMESISDRNLTSHDYDEDVASGIYRKIVDVYQPLFAQLEEKMRCL